MEADPEFLGPAALAKGLRFVGDARDAVGGRAARGLQLRARHLGLHALLLLQRALPEGRRSARRDRQARRRVDQGGDRPRHGREAREVVRHLGEDDRLAARDRARAEDAGRSSRRSSRPGSRSRSPSTARCRRPCRRTSRRTSTRRARSTTSSRRRASTARSGIVQGEHALEPDRVRRSRRRAKAESRRAGARRDVRTPRSEPSSMKVAYYKGCLASLSAKELDISTQALAPLLDLELDELESVTCCGAGDIHEAEPDYYLHLNARILAYAEATGAETLMTICNVCTLNLRQANWQLKGDEALRERVNRNLSAVGVPPYSGSVEVRHLLWLIAEGEGYELLKQVAHKGLKGPQGGAVLRLPDPAAVEDHGLRGSRSPVVARGDHRGVRRRGDRLSREDQVLRLPDHPGARGDGAARADPADRAGDGRRRRRDGDAVPALPPVARRVAVEAARVNGSRLQHADPAPVAADRRRRRLRGIGAEVQAARGDGASPCSRSCKPEGARRGRRGRARVGVVRSGMGSARDA